MRLTGDRVSLILRQAEDEQRRTHAPFLASPSPAWRDRAAKRIDGRGEGGRLADILRANSTTPLTLILSPVKNGGEENFFSVARPCGDAVVRCRSAGTVIVSWKTIGKLDPRQLFRTVGVKLRRKVLRLLEAGGVEVNLVGVLVVFESHWRSAIGAKQPARARRGPVHLRCLASEAIRVLRHAEPCCEW
jgi:hypothetical protein